MWYPGFTNVFLRMVFVFILHMYIYLFYSPLKDMYILGYEKILIKYWKYLKTDCEEIHHKIYDWITYVYPRLGL